MDALDLLTIEDVNLICAASDATCHTREQVIEKILGIMPYIQNAKTDIHADRTIFLLKEMSDDEFDSCHFSEMMEEL